LNRGPRGYEPRGLPGWPTPLRRDISNLHVYKFFSALERGNGHVTTACGCLCLCGASPRRPTQRLLSAGRPASSRGSIFCLPSALRGLSSPRSRGRGSTHRRPPPPGLWRGPHMHITARSPSRKVSWRGRKRRQAGEEAQQVLLRTRAGGYLLLGEGREA
jgi:hypothetical protein